MLFGDPGHFFPHVGTHDLDGDRGMIPGRQDVADVVYERRENHLVVGVVPLGPGRRLQAMGQPADLVAPHGTVEQGHRRQNATGVASGPLLFQAAEKIVFLPGAILHGAKCYVFHRSAPLGAR